MSSGNSRPRALGRLALPALILAGGYCAPSDGGVEEWTTWSHYLGDPGRTHYSSLAQIDTTNVAELELAWSYASGGLEPGVETQIQHSPIIVDSALYGTNARLLPFRIDARTGGEVWRLESLDEGDLPSWFGKSRGLMRWVSPDGMDERLYFGVGSHLYAADARTGRLVEAFGAGGAVDLREGLGRDPAQQLVSMNTPGAVFEDLIIVGTRAHEVPGASPGHVRAYDARSGALVWTFHTIPQPGEPGYETWPADAYTYTGGANSWAGMSLDEERGIVFVPTGSAAFDYYGGDRVGDNLFANTLLALDARTGERVWHYQVVRHDLWDRDLPAPPNLVTLERDGARIPAVAQITKSGHVFVFHRETGEPLFPIEEVAVPVSSTLGEATAATQPLPALPAPFGRQRLTEEMLYEPDRPALIANLVGESGVADMTVREYFKTLTSGGQFVPPDTAGVVVLPGLDGGGEWGAAAVDPTRGILYVNASEMAWVVQLLRIDPTVGRGEALFRLNCVRCHGGSTVGVGVGPPLEAVGARMGRDSAAAVIRLGRGAMPAHPQLTDDDVTELLAYLDDPSAEPAGAASDADDADTALVSPERVPYGLAAVGRLLDDRGKPVIEPPWGTLSAIDLNTGETLWRVPLGDDPEIDDPDHPVTGTENYGGPVVTAGGLVFIAATRDEKIRAFHARTGEQLWEAPLPAGGYATPATYQVDGRQYVVIAAGGGKMGTPSGDRYVAFALPDGPSGEQESFVPLFDGRTLDGWEGDETLFSVRDGAIAAGTLDRPIDRSEYLCTTREFDDFEVRLEARLEGGQNGGVQFRAKRVPGTHEVGGYQADIGFIAGRFIPMLSDAEVDTTGDYPLWGSLLDEYRPRPARYPDPGSPYRLLAVADRAVVEDTLHPGSWNELAVTAIGPRVEIRLNGVRTAAYVEPEDVPRAGAICLQAHSGGPSIAWYRDIEIRQIEETEVP
jgi:quinoprotein glucose dehydrogenase